VYFLIAAVNFEIHDFKYWRADWPTHSVQKTSVAFDDFGRWNNLIRKTPYAHKKKEPFSLEMYLKISLSSQCLELPNPKPGGEVSALPDYPLFHGWKANWGLKLSQNILTPEYDHVHIYSPWRRQSVLPNNHHWLHLEGHTMLTPSYRKCGAVWQ
jgi:hypothetical protein